MPFLKSEHTFAIWKNMGLVLKIAFYPTKTPKNANGCGRHYQLITKQEQMFFRQLFHPPHAIKILIISRGQLKHQFPHTNKGRASMQELIF